MSQDASYDVYVKLGVDHMGRPEFSDALAHFREEHRDEPQQVRATEGR